MVIRISSSFIQEANRLTIQRHKLTLEPYVSNLGNVLLAVTPVIFKEKGDGGSSVPVRAVQWQFKYVSAGDRLRDLEGLCG